MNLFLDLDGTLVDSRPGITRSIEYALEKLGIAIPEQQFLVSFIGPPLHQTFATLLNTNDQAQIDHAVSVYRERYAKEGVFEATVYPGVEKVLAEYFKMGVGLYLATSKAQVYAKQILEHFGLDQYFKGIHGSELDGTRSDKTELIEYILKHEELTDRHVTMVGDRSHDIKGGRANKLQTVGVLWGYGSKEELLTAGADMIIEDPADLGWMFDYYEG